MKQKLAISPSVESQPFTTSCAGDDGDNSAFDDIVCLAAALFAGNTVYIRVGDDDKQQIVAYHGNINPLQFGGDVAGDFCVKSRCFFNSCDIRHDKRLCNHSLDAYRNQVVSFAAMPLLSKEGDMLGLLAVISDQPMLLADAQIKQLLTLSRHAVAELAGRKERTQLGTQLLKALKLNDIFRQTKKAARIGAWDYDLVNNQIYWSGMTRAILDVADGYVPKIETALGFYKEGHSLDIITNCMRNAIHNHIPFDEEVQVITKTGVSIWVRVKGDAILEEGKCTRLFGTLQDIQQQKEQQNKLAASERKYRSIVENSLAAHLLTDPANGKILSCNGAAAAMFGYTIEELLQQHRRTIIYINDPNYGVLAAKRDKDGRIQGQLTGIRKSGEHFQLLYSSALFQDGDGQTRASMTAIDISEIKNTENALRISKDEFSSAFEFASIGMAMVSLQGKWLRVNKSLCNMLGYTSEELLHMNFQQITHPEDLKSDLHLVNQLLAGEANRYQLEKRYYTKAGDVIWINLSVSLVCNQQGQPQHFISQVENITERKAAVQALTEEKETLASVIEATHAAVWERNIQTGETIYNERWAEMLGYTLAELKPISKHTWTRLTHPGDRKLSDIALQACFNKETEYYDCEYRMKHKQGHWMWVLDRGKVTSFTPDDKPLKMFGIHLDITVRKNIVEALEQKQALIETVTNTINVGIIACDNHGVKTLFNKAAREICGLPADYTSKEGWSNFYQLYQADGTTSIPAGDSPLYRALAEGEVRNMEVVLVPEHGQTRFLSANGHQIKDAQGLVTGAVVALHDITGHKKAEQSLIFNERRFKGIFDSTFSFIGFLAPDGTLLEANETILRFSGARAEQVINKKLWECYWGQTTAEEQEKLKGKIARAAKGELLEYELEIENAKGNKITILFNLKPLLDEQGKVIAIVSEGRPIQEIVDARKALLEKNEELQQFAFTASHDLKEPLRMVHSFMGLLRDSYRSQLDDKGKKYIDYAIDGSERMTDMVNQLLTYARIGSKEAVKEVIDTNDLIKNVLALQKAVLEEKEAEIKVEPLPSVHGLRTPLSLLFQNLLGNSIKYQRGNTRPVIIISGWETAGEYQFSISDNGIGIDKKYHGEIFQLFKRLHTRQEFTGAGMGLATCKKIVEQHGGKIWVQSEEGRGSTFHFTIKK